MPLIIAFALALAAAAALTPVVILLARKRGWVVQPREDRWHRRPTAVYGGVAIYLAFLIAFFVMGRPGPRGLTLVGCASAMFLIGLVDDIVDLKPQVKFLAQLLVATIAVALGLSFTLLPWPWLNVPLTLLWLVGVTNAVNILDNMDGLSSGVALVRRFHFGSSVIGHARARFPEMGLHRRQPWPEPPGVFSSTTSTRPKFSWATAAAFSWASAWPGAPFWERAGPAT